MSDDRWPIEDHDLTELWLDPENVRITNPQAGESSIAAYLVQAEDVVGLALGIARDGYVDNELPVVALENDRLMVLEGNRRLTGLKLLTETLAPDRPGGVAFADAAVERLSRRYPRALSRTVRVMVAPSRAVAQPLLARLHTANPKKSWLREQQAIFYHAQLDRGRTVDDLRSDFPGADDIPRFIRMGEMRALIRGLKFTDGGLREWILGSKLAMTSFEYAYRSPDVLAALGLAFSADGLLARRALTEGQSNALQYLLAKFKDGSLNTRSPEFRAGKKGEEPNPARLEFLDAVRAIVAGLPPDSTAPTTASASEDSEASEATADVDQEDAPGATSKPSGKSEETNTNVTTGSTGSNRGPNRRETQTRLDMNGFAYQGSSAGMRRRFEELAKLDVTMFPNAAYDLLRTILECAGKVYLRTNAPGRLQPGATLKTVLTTLKAEFASESYVLGILNQIDAGGPQTAANYAGTAQALNAINHEPDHFSQGHEVHAAWDRIKPLVIRLLS